MNACVCASGGKTAELIMMRACYGTGVDFEKISKKLYYERINNYIYNSKMTKTVMAFSDSLK